MVECTTGTPKVLMALAVEAAFLTRARDPSSRPGQLRGLVVEEQERCALRREEMAGERVTRGAPVVGAAPAGSRIGCGRSQRPSR
jgi:hypothetical protein